MGGTGRNGWTVQGQLNRSPPLLRRAGLQHLFGKRLLEVAHLVAQLLDLTRGRLARGIVLQCCPHYEGPIPRSGSFLRPNTACGSCGEYPAPSARRCLSNSSIPVSSSFPFGHDDEPEILRYEITSICPISADVSWQSPAWDTGRRCRKRSFRQSGRPYGV